MAAPTAAFRLRSSPDARRIVRARGLRALIDGLVAVILPGYLLATGLDTVQVGAVITATLLGSSAVTLGIGLRGGAVPRRLLLQVIAVAMVVTGIAFASLEGFVVLLVVAALGTINPSSGDVSGFLPVEQALLPDTVPSTNRTSVFARYSLIASLAGAFGALAAGLPEVVARRTDLSVHDAQRGVFLLYAVIGGVLLLQYRHLSVGASHPIDQPPSRLGPSRSLVYRLAGIFSVDALGGGFAVQSILVLWLSLRFDLSTVTSGAVFFWSGVLSASSALLAPRLAKRIGLIRTMVFTHLPANLLLMAAALMPDAGLAVACLLARSLLSQMDVPARTSYVMAVVRPEERAAAASVTNVPRSLAAALPPLAAGWMLDHSTFGWPLLIAGALKAGYDLALLALFRDIRPEEELAASPDGPSGSVLGSPDGTDLIS
ncbi:MAG: MFS transporter [Actinomycetota bacterium]